MANTAQAGLSPRLYGGAPNWTENPVGYGSALADWQLSDWQAQLQKYPRIYNSDFAGQYPGLARPGGGAYGAAPQTGNNGAGGGTWSGPAWGPAPGTGTGSSGGAAPGFPLLQTPKSPAGNAALAGLLGQTATLSNDPSQTLFTATRDPAQAGRIAAGGAQLDASTGQANQRLADFTSAFYAARPQAKAQTDQEIASIGSVYAPESDPTSMAGTLNRLAAQRYQAAVGNRQRQDQMQQRLAKLEAQGAGGNSSYISQQLMDTMEGNRVKLALEQGDLNRTNYLTTRAQQNALLGQRSGLLTNYLTGALVPINAGQQLVSGQLANLGLLGNISNANRLQQTPEQLLAARLGLLGQYGSDLNGLNLFGVGGNFNSPAQRWGPPPLARPYSPDNPGNGLGDNSMIDARTGLPSNNGATRAVPPEIMRLSPDDQRAAAYYHQQSGSWPGQDASFSPDLWQWAQGMAYPNRAEAPGGSGLPGGSVDLNSGENEPYNPFQWITNRTSAGSPTSWPAPAPDPDLQDGGWGGGYR